MKTFAEWSNLGYKIVRGSKATWVDDVAKFSENQVMKYKPVSNRNKDTVDMHRGFDAGGEIGGYGSGLGADWGV